MLLAALSLLITLGSVGILVAVATARPPTGPGFWRLTILLAVVGLAGGLGLRWLEESALPPPSNLALLAYVVAAGGALASGIAATVATTRDRPAPSWPTVAAGAAGVAAVLVDPGSYAASEVGTWVEVLYTSGFLSSGVAVGSVVLAMILAHWYLVEPRLPLGPLRNVLLLFAATELFKVAHIAAVFALHGPSWSRGPGGFLQAFVLGNALFVVLRGVLGIMTPLVLAWLTWKTVEIRSIQSATGILYAAVVLVLFGDVISIFLTLSTGLPH